MNKPDNKLIELAYEVVHLKDKDKEFDFGNGTDYQGELYLCWDGSKFQAELTVYSEPHTTGGWYLDPPETTWTEVSESFESIKIKAVAEWLKTWGFEF